MFLFPPLSTLVGFLCVGERYWMCLETYSYMFLSWYVQRPGHPPELLFYEVTGSQWDTHGSAAVALWLTLVHWIQWTHCPRTSTQPSLCSFRDTHHRFNTSFKMVQKLVSLWGMLQVLKQNESQKHRRHMIRKCIFNIFIKCSTCDESKQGVKTTKQR